MVLVVVLALGGAGRGIKYVHDQAAEHHRKQAASQRQLDRGADTAGRAPAPAGAIP